MLTYNRIGIFSGMSSLALGLCTAYSQKELYIAYGKACGYAFAQYPQNISNEELTRYEKLLKLLAREKEIGIAKNCWK